MSEHSAWRKELEAACLEGLIHTEHGWRYRPALGAEAVERFLLTRVIPSDGSTP